MGYATNTEVSVEKTEAEIRALLRRYKADRFMAGEDPDGAIVTFEMRDRRIMFRLPLPDRDDNRFRYNGRRSPRTAEQRFKVWEQECRSKWRALFLCIKAKLESVEAGIELFDDAFLAHVVTPNGQTMGERLRPDLDRITATGTLPPLLPPPAAS